MPENPECIQCQKDNCNYSEIVPVFAGFESGYQKISDVKCCNLHGIVRVEDV